MKLKLAKMILLVCDWSIVTVLAIIALPFMVLSYPFDYLLRGYDRVENYVNKNDPDYRKAKWREW